MENLITASKSVNALMEEFRSGDIAIPEIQRDVVWTAEQVKNLIDSISRGYPCGAMILWEPREKDKKLVEGMIKPERLQLYDGRLPRYFLLDGQQRITALASVLLKRDDIRELLAEIEEEMPFVFANVMRFPRDLEATTDPVGYGFPWILFNKLFDGSFRTEPGFSELGPEMHDRLQRYVQGLRDYQFPVQIISGRDYASVAEIFTRVNSAGTQLTGAEIHLARIVPHWRGITSEFRQYRQELGQRSYDLDLTMMYILMRNRNATDWGTASRRTLDQIEPRRLQLHHIFPFDHMIKNKAILKSYLDEGLTPADFRNDINDLANLTFLSREKNIELSNTPPSQYLANETTRETRKAHFIPEDPHLWKTESFREFLQERRELLAQAITSMLRRL